MCPFLVTLPAPPFFSGQSGSGKTEASKKIVQFLSSLEQEQMRDRGCQVRGSWPFLKDPRGTILLWARRVVFRPLASPWGQPQALTTAEAGGVGLTLPWTSIVPRHSVLSWDV